MSFYSWTASDSGPIKSLGETYNYLELVKSELDKKRPLPPDVVKNLQDEFSLQYTYNSNAIEGNSLTLRETMCVIKDGMTISGKSVREHLEATNHNEAIGLLTGLANKQVSLDETTIKALHSVVLHGIDNKNAGHWRTFNVFIGGATHTPPPHQIVPGMMEEFIDWYNGDAQKLSSVERAARVHADFVTVHPFSDGNGRTARLLMNLELAKAGYPLAIVKVKKRMGYYDSLDMASAQGHYKPFAKLVCNLVEDSFKMYSKALGCSLECRAKMAQNNERLL